MQRSEDGYELQFAVNHLGHFLLTARLMPALLSAPNARVVSVTSTGRHIGRAIDERDLRPSARYDPWRAYGRSKLANIHFALELQRRSSAADVRIKSVVAHPGLSPTRLQRSSVEASHGGRSQRFFHALARATGMPPHRAAACPLRAATDPAARGGTLYAPRFINTGPPVRRPLFGRSVRRTPARRLWALSEQATDTTFDVAALAREHTG